MKTIILALIASVSARQHSPLYNQKMVQFATGMNGDEDLGQDIIMKGEKFHYNQLPPCNGTNGKPGVDCEKPGSLTQMGSKLSWMLPTCDKFVTENCQPVCTESETTGCTEASAGIEPPRDRFEGKYTHKGERF